MSGREGGTMNDDFAELLVVFTWRLCRLIFGFLAVVFAAHHVWVSAIPAAMACIYLYLLELA